MGSVTDLVQGGLEFSVEPYMSFGLYCKPYGHVEFLAYSLRTSNDRLHLARLFSSARSRFRMVLALSD